MALEDLEPCWQYMIHLVTAVILIAIVPMLVFVLIGIGAALCPNGWNSISASVSLAGVDFVGSNLSYANFTFNVRIELLADYDTKYGNTTLFLRSRDGTNLDGSEISGAHVRKGETRRLDASVKLVSRYRFDGSALVYSDPVVSDGGDGVVKLWTHVTFSGKGRRLVYKLRPVDRSTCELTVDLRSRALVFSECKPHVRCKAKA